MKRYPPRKNIDAPGKRNASHIRVSEDTEISSGEKILYESR
jgi:hypothetical protein